MQCFFGKRIGMNVFDSGRNFVEFVTAGMQHRDLVTAPHKPVKNKMTGRPGPSNDKRLQNNFPPTVRGEFSPLSGSISFNSATSFSQPHRSHAANACAKRSTIALLPIFADTSAGIPW